MIINVGKEDFTVKYTESPMELNRAIEDAVPQFLTYDVESTGLHIKKDRPTIGAVCIPSTNTVYIFPTTKAILSQLPKWSKMVKRIYAHNTTFDMHMTANIVGDGTVLQVENWGDTMGLCRLVFEAISTRDGGDKLGLKPVGKKYIDKDCDVYEKELKEWMKKAQNEQWKILAVMIRGIMKETGWTKDRIVKMIEKDAEPIPDQLIPVIEGWRQDYPMPTYADVPEEILLPYLAVDVILCSFLVKKSLPVIKHRDQVKTMEREFRLLRTVFKMERPGIKVDRPYLQESYEKLTAYTDELYAKLHEIMGDDTIKVTQSNKIRDYYRELLEDETLQSVNKQFLKRLAGQGDKAAGIISRLRRLEKWRSTYVRKILKDSEYDGRFYTSMNQFNPVSGRFSGDAQQFPKDPILTAEGYEWERANPGQKVPKEYILYHPRHAFQGTIYYLDYSQVELRMQGHYTLPFGGDTNLCRAYMPYKCVHYRTGETYDFKDVLQRKRWSELRHGSPQDLHWEKALEKGYSAWVNPDTNEPWVPTDVHSSTTIKALEMMGIDPKSLSEEKFKWWRGKGKQFNFMRNYGGGDKMAAETLEIKLEEASAMNKGYTSAFPIVVVYQNQVTQAMYAKGYVQNIRGRRYYVTNSNRFYKCGNYLIQGSCADLLKEKMIEIDDFLTSNNLEDAIQMILCVHDELQFAELKPGYEWAIAKIKEIMEDCPDVMVPIVAEVEKTETTWDQKKAYHVAA